MIQNDVVSPTLNTNEASLGIATVGIAFHLDPSHVIRLAARQSPSGQEGAGRELYNV